MVAATHLPVSDVAEVRDGRLTPLFHQGQRRAYWSDARITLVLAGTQGGKTVIGPWWLHRQMQRFGPGDYIVAGPELTLLRKKAIPEFCRFFEDTIDAGRFIGSPDPRFVLSPHGERFIFGREQATPTTVWFGHGDDPDSLESMTANAAWLDEPGQKKFRRESFEAIDRRLSLADGPKLLTTTPYVLGWLKAIYDQAQTDPTIAVINFPSIANPRFPREVWDRARDSLPTWKFNMFYRGRFERPAGLIYDCFDPARHLIPRFAIPDDWPRFQGTDFGGVNTAAVFLAHEPGTPRHYVYREYLAGGRTAREHAAAWTRPEPCLPTCIGGSHSEGQWRKEFAAASYPIKEPDIRDVEVGIDRVYGAFARDELFVFDDLAGLRDEITTYSRVLDAGGEPTEAIEDKETYHRLDGLRYVVGWLNRQRRKVRMQ